MTDFIRMSGMFDQRLLKTRAVVVGCGALGSAVALSLAKIGVPLELWDPDVVEPHNIPNQILYGPGDVGSYKATCLKDRIEQLSGTPATAHVRRWDQDTVFSARHAYVFVCVDTMAARKEILSTISFEPGAILLDGRIGARDWSTFLVDRSDLRAIRDYASTLVDDDDAFVERGACGNVLSIGATAGLAASYLIWQFMDHVMGRQTVTRVDGSVNPFYMTAYTPESADGKSR